MKYDDEKQTNGSKEKHPLDSLAYSQQEEDKEEMKIESIFDPDRETQISKQKYLDSMDYPQESIQNLKDATGSRKSDASYPLIIVHPAGEGVGNYPPRQNKPEEREEERIEDDAPPKNGSPRENLFQQKPGIGTDSKLGTEILEFIWNFIVSSYHLKNVTNQVIQSVKQQQISCES